MNLNIITKFEAKYSEKLDFIIEHKCDIILIRKTSSRK